MKNPFKKTQKETATEGLQLHKYKGTLGQRIRQAREALANPNTEFLRGNPAHTKHKVRLPFTRREQNKSYSSAATTNDSTVNVSRADQKGTRSLRGTMIHRNAKTVRGTSVVPDKPDTVVDPGSQ